MDGQHRLLAIIQYGGEIEILVARGLPKVQIVGDLEIPTIDGIDQGVKRTVCDQLKLNHGVETNTNRFVSSLRSAAACALGIEKTKRFTVRKALTAKDVYGKEVEAIASIMQGFKPTNTGNLIGAIAFAASTRDRLAVIEFITAVVNGENLRKGMPAYTIREYLTNLKQKVDGRARILSHHVRDVILNGAWNHVKGSRLSMAKGGKIGGDYFRAKQKKNVDDIKASFYSDDELKEVSGRKKKKANNE